VTASLYLLPVFALRVYKVNFFSKKNGFYRRIREWLAMKHTRNVDKKFM